MKKTLIIVIALLIFWSCSKPGKNTKKQHTTSQNLTRQLPRVLYITTGVDTRNEDMDLPKGISIALQYFNKKGISVHLSPRDILFDEKALQQYNFIILNTAKNYHDADRQYSLSYMTDEELIHLKNYVKQGGVIIAGDNVGRNRFDGTDRITNQEDLNNNNYPLAEVFGYTFIEKNLKNFEIKGQIDSLLQGVLLKKNEADWWTLIPEKKLSDNVQVLGYWQNNKDKIPALIHNKYGKGSAYLLPTSDLINPIVSGGFWSPEQIESFYQYIINNYQKEHQIDVQINPWPESYSYAFAVSFNPEGKLTNYKKLIKNLHKQKIPAQFFVSGKQNDSLKKLLHSEKVKLASTGYDYIDFIQADYAYAVNDILRNQSVWQTSFTGFRFPYTSPSFTGLMALHTHGYHYDSSISANNLEFLQGCVVPYNIVFSKENYYTTTRMLELAPTYHDDYFFLQELTRDGYQNPGGLQKNIQLFNQYLLDYWQFAVKPYNGLMIYLGHPGLTAYNDETLKVLNNIVDTCRKDNTWISDLDEIYRFRNFFNQVQIYLNQNKTTKTIDIKTPAGISYSGFSVQLPRKPKSFSAKKGKIKHLEQGKKHYLIFDAFDGQVIKWKY